MRRLDNELAKTWQRHATRPSLIDQGRDPRVHTHHVSVEAETASDVLIHVGVGVDEARQHEFAGHVQDFLGAIARDRCLHRRNASILYRHIQGTIYPLRRIDHPATAQQHVVLHAWCSSMVVPGPRYLGTVSRPAVCCGCCSRPCSRISVNYLKMACKPGHLGLAKSM